MTIPRERALALPWERKLLKELSHCNEAPGHLRADAKHILRHYPRACEVVCAARAAPADFEFDEANPVVKRALREAGNDDLY